MKEKWNRICCSTVLVNLLQSLLGNNVWMKGLNILTLPSFQVVLKLIQNIHIIETCYLQLGRDVYRRVGPHSKDIKQSAIYCIYFPPFYDPWKNSPTSCLFPIQFLWRGLQWFLPPSSFGYGTNQDWASSAQWPHSSCMVLAEMQLFLLITNCRDG